MNVRHGWLLAVICFLFGCSPKEHLQTEVLTTPCIKPYLDYRYLTGSPIRFTVNTDEFVIPPNFETDLASIPKIIWPIMAPSHSSFIKAAIIHDWFYRKTCDFDRFQTDVIFYHMLINDGVSPFKAATMYYAVRLFGSQYYNEDYCNDD